MLNTQNFTDKDLIYICKNNNKIRSAMAYSNTFQEVASVVKSLMNVSEKQLQVIEKFWKRNDKK
jgi:hypothetical protein